jgi:hypothetical protein
MPKRFSARRRTLGSVQIVLAACARVIVMLRVVPLCLERAQQASLHAEPFRRNRRLGPERDDRRGQIVPSGTLQAIDAFAVVNRFF